MNISMKKISKLTKKLQKAKRKGKKKKARRLKEELKYFVRGVTNVSNFKGAIPNRSFNIPQHVTHYGPEYEWSEEDGIRYKQAFAEADMRKEYSGQAAWDRELDRRIFDRGRVC